MNVEALADILKRRGCAALHYFHTDHFEPWSNSLDAPSARAVDDFARQARLSPYARRLSLFYNVFIPYRPGDAPAEAGDERIPGDNVVFAARSPQQETLARDVIRPLVVPGAHEIHLHVHHEFWTRNTSNFDQPVSKWVNAHSTAAADSARLDLHLRLCMEAIARETGMPFDRWAFIHGNWALNGSDPLICHIHDEMALLQKHGCFGDFSFPAGRSYCDPRLDSPFTCLPVTAERAYDTPQADARAVGLQTKAFQPGRFFIWNSPIKAVHSSLDYFSPANRALFSNPEKMVSTWLDRSVCIGRTLFLKTHAHSMKSDYRIGEPDSMIPHRHSDIVAMFDLLMRACERAGVEFKLQTVNDIMTTLHGLDGTHAEAPPPSLHTAPTAPPDKAPTLAAVAAELLDIHAGWLAGPGATLPPDELYQDKLRRRTPLELYERALARALVDRYPPEATRIVEIGTGWGGLSILLARLGFEVFGFEGNVQRHTAARWTIDEAIRRHPELAKRLMLAPMGLFPQAMTAAALSRDKINVGLITNITSTYSAEHTTEIVERAGAFDELVLDLARLGKSRDSATDKRALFDEIRASTFRPLDRLVLDEPYEYWRFRSRGPGPSHRPGASQPADAPDQLHGQQGLLFHVVGDKRLPDCPVCRSRETAPLWRIPETALPKPINVFGGYFDKVPTLQIPGEVYCFDFCQNCESIFLNPVLSAEKEGYRKTDHYVRKMKDAAEWKGYEENFDGFASWIPKNAKVMIDAACGVGQYIEIARRRGTHKWQRLIGLELAEKYVAHMKAQGLEAHQFDVDTDDLDRIVAPGSVDFIAFSEGFEHVERPLDALAKLLRALRPGGRLYMTAQRYGRDVLAAVRPGEPIYIGEKLVGELPLRLKCRIVNTVTTGTRYKLVLEKK